MEERQCQNTNEALTPLEAGRGGKAAVQPNYGLELTRERKGNIRSLAMRSQTRAIQPVVEAEIRKQRQIQRK
jgi:hypothetical protein